ncbi:glycosyltransferase family protein [Ensifer soli]|uniref:glycosyltransferase family protein n=1 Tax=Ciceribacter sp. sgz301302 TaxID=3342379 RepID=UPI0035BABF44
MSAEGDPQAVTVRLAGEGPKSYFRVLWPCPGIDKLASFLSVDDSLDMSAVLNQIDAEEGDLAWVGLVEKRNETLKLLQTLWDGEALKTPGDKVTIPLRRGKAGAAVYVCFHFQKLTRPATIIAPTLSWAPISHVSVFPAAFKDQRLAVKGWARHPLYPGLPVRVELVVDGVIVDETIARTPTSDAGGEKKAPPGAYAFAMTAVLPRGEDLPAATVRIKGERDGELVEVVVPDIAITVELEDERELPRPATILGKIDNFSRTEIIGWALCKEDPFAPVDLILELDGAPIIHTRCSIFRDDVMAAHGGSGVAGFRFELPNNIESHKPVTALVRPVEGTNAIKNNFFTFPTLGGHNFSSILPPASYEVTAPKSAGAAGPVSVVILNRNCARLLDDMFASAARVEDLSLIEWVVVDHNSTDASREVCETAKAQGHDVTFLLRRGNFSFSDSNNYGAARARYPVLIFANNDLIFRAPFVREVQADLGIDGVGLVGSSLYDYIPNAKRFGEEPLQHLGVYLNRATAANKWIRPFEARATQEVTPNIDRLTEVPFVTGAFMAMTKDDFDAVGGFGVEYTYGLEDIDLCMKVMERLGKTIVSDNALNIVHHRGFSRSKELDVTIRQRNNNIELNARWGGLLRTKVKNDVLRRPGFWAGTRPTIGFAVVGAGDNTTAGEYYTALELGRALQKHHPVHLRFLVEKEWYDLTGIDVLVVMVNRFNLTKVKTASPFLVTINWTRQWFDRWAEDETLPAYDVVFASSQRAADYLHERTGIEVGVLPIASDAERFSKRQPHGRYQCDYCLTGNKVGTVREIEYQLDPPAINGVGAIFGANWENTPLASIARGQVPYSEIDKVYASSKIVIDDANIATKDWGSCNSRVFDAIASGCLLITNGALGVQELFGDLVPTFSDRQSLTDTLNYWIGHRAERLARVNELRQLLLERHTYAHRAEVVANALTAGRIRTRIAIKCAARTAERHVWGDYHFANSLATSLRALGFTVRVDCFEAWNSGLAESDDVVISLRGLYAYKPKPNQLNILWLISHPRDVPTAEIEKYDHVYVASRLHAERLQTALDVPVEVLLQCADTRRFPFREGVERTEKPIFVGNSRGVFRPTLKWCVENEADIEIYGAGWEQFVSDWRLKGRHLPNEVLSSFYEKASVVLCDHWEDMKQDGYLSNRAFDVLACGGWLAVDDVVGIGDILPGGYSVFRNKDELKAILDTPGFGDEEGRAERAKWVDAHHSFDARAREISRRIALMAGEGEKTVSDLNVRASIE